VDYLPVRYPPDARAVWKLVPVPASQDTLVDEFLVEVREVTAGPAPGGSH
jgi:hypothetical protein